MPNLTLDWGAIASNGTTLESFDGATTSIDTGGIAVDIAFTAVNPTASAFVSDFTGYVAPGEAFSGDTNLKLTGNGNMEPGTTSTTTLDFSSSNDAFASTVQNVTFRLDDVDAGSGSDFDSDGPGWQDIVTVTAIGADGTAIPVTLSTDGTPSITGTTASGATETFFQQAEGSVLVNIPGPVARIELTYANGQGGGQGVMVSDVLFETRDADGGGNTAPVAVDDTLETDADTQATIDAAANDTDADGDTLTVTDVSDPDNGTASIDGNGNVTYTPDAGFTGTDTITYTVSDGNGGTDTGTITVTVGGGGTGGNQAPVAVDDLVDTTEGTPATFDPAANDSDPDGDELTLTSIGTPTNGTATLNENGTVTYTPNDGFTGEDTITYVIDDGNGNTDQGTITVTVGEDTVTTDGPDAIDDAASTDFETAVDIPVLTNDVSPPNETITITAVGAASNGVAFANADGTITYEPAGDFEGTDSFTYTIEDDDGGTDTATVTVTVGDTTGGGGNQAPTAVDDSETTPEDTSVLIDPLFNDTDPDGDPLTITQLGTPTNGTAILNENGEVEYTPNAGFVGTDTIPYTISDGNGGTDEGVITVTVTEDTSGGGNTPPETVDDLVSTEEETPVTISPADNDIDADGDDLTVTQIGTPVNGVAVLNGDGTVTYTPNDGFSGEDTIPYTVDDGNGGTDDGVILVTVGDDTGTGGNGAPDAVDDTARTLPDTAINVVVLGNDTDPDGDTLSVTGITTAPQNGTAFVNGDGTITYTPNAGYLGDDTLTYEINDGNGGTDTAVLTITVTNGDDGLIDRDIFPVSEELQSQDPLNGFDEDPNPTDDLDNVVGTAGGDVILTGDDADTISAGGGNDTILPGVDDDVVDGGAGDDRITDAQGADTIMGGAGNDTIIAGIDTFSDYVGDDPNLPILGFTSDPNTEDGRDSVSGGDGDDFVQSGDDADTLGGDLGDDTLDGGIDDDLIYGDQGDDSLIGSHGSDTLFGGEGDDFLDGRNLTSLEILDATDAVPTNDLDSLVGGTGDDTLLGGDDDDTLEGGAGDDSIDGGIDEDSLEGGEGDDTLVGGAGADTINGGEGRDLIDGATIGDVVDGGSTPIGTGADGRPLDFDTLDLTGSAPTGGSLQVTYTSADREDGFVEFFGADRTDDSTPIGTMVFEDIENVIPCFTPGTMIATPEGERRVEDLEPGDRVITRDNGIQTVRWAGRKDLTAEDLSRHGHLRPILIRAGALGKGLPETDLLVSPNHRVLISNDKTALYFEEHEVLVAAKHLTGLDGVDEVDAMGISYIHVMFDRHEVLLSNGAWTESFQPGDHSLAGIGNAQRTEILELFPHLAQQQGRDAYVSARRSLKKHEALLLVK